MTKKIGSTDIRSAADFVVEFARKEGYSISSNDATARQEMGRLLLATRVAGENEFDVRVIVERLKDEYPIDTRSAGALCPDNIALANAFDELGKLALKAGDGFKSRAYIGAADAIRELTYAVVDGQVLSKGKTKVKGIGKGTADKIDEFLQDGKIAKTDLEHN